MAKTSVNEHVCAVARYTRSNICSDAHILQHVVILHKIHHNPQKTKIQNLLEMSLSG